MRTRVTCLCEMNAIFSRNVNSSLYILTSNTMSPSTQNVAVEKMNFVPSEAYINSALSCSCRSDFDKYNSDGSVLGIQSDGISSEQEWISISGDAFFSSTTNFPKPQHVIFPTEQNDFRSFSKMEDEWYLVTTGVPPSTKYFSKPSVSHSKTSTK